ncbi:MAG: group 1 truncated hemoglobin [Planctomycetes bacterium]|nr:group 1 truncated hemoglobin [Planctomycetota bacterium]
MQFPCFLRTSALLAVLCVSISCASTSQSSMPALYERLGGKPAITAVVDEFVGNVAADARIHQRFGKTDIAHLKRMLVDQIGSASGGPEKYMGRDMRSAHRGMKITEGEFTALVEDLVRALNKFQVPAREQNELIGPLAPMKSDIVGV